MKTISVIELTNALAAAANGYIKMGLEKKIYYNVLFFLLLMFEYCVKHRPPPVHKVKTLHFYPTV